MMRNNDPIRGMSLTEILVVIIIMGVLAALVYPSALAIRSKARTVKCTSQLRNIGTMLKLYEADNGEYPPWLSNLVPTYISLEQSWKMLVCPNDYASPTGSEGRLSSTITGLNRYAELNDIFGASGGAGGSVFAGKGRWSSGMPKDSPASLRNQQVTFCSYSYEFALSSCTYWHGGTFPDTFGNRDGVVSWREVKTIAEGQGVIDDQGTIDHSKAYDGKVPIVRCFWHIPPNSIVSSTIEDPRFTVLNLRSGDMSVSRSDATEITSTEGLQFGWMKD